VDDDKRPPFVTLPPSSTAQYYYELKTSLVNVSSVNRNKVDVLVIVDNSISMELEQKNMAEKFSQFIDKLQGLDWQVGIITTDTSPPNTSDSNNLNLQKYTDGKLIEIHNSPDEFILTSKMETMTVKEKFSNTLQNLGRGSGYEQGIKATYRALERALDPSNSKENLPNKNFIRPDSMLAVLVVSDANETPEYSEPKNLAVELYNFIRKSWNHTKKIIFNSIIVPAGDEICLNYPNSVNEDYGYEYIKMSNLTGGLVGSVCATEYGSQLAKMGEKTLYQIKSLQLDCTPEDVDNDGKKELRIYHLPPGGTTWRTLSETMYKIEPLSTVVQFYNYLPEGNYKINYYCRR